MLGDLKSACTSIIDSYWDDIWKLIAQEVVCDLLTNQRLSSDSVGWERIESKL